MESLDYDVLLVCLGIYTKFPGSVHIFFVSSNHRYDPPILSHSLPLPSRLVVTRRNTASGGFLTT